MEATKRIEDQQTVRTSFAFRDIHTFPALLLFIFIAVGFRWQHDNWLGDYDRLTQFLPWYDYVGNAIREFRIPAWSPADASGAPIAGSPATGWLYVLAMVPFALLDAIEAYKIFVLLQALVAGSSTYLLSRWLGLNPFSALVASTTFAIGPMLYAATTYATGVSQVLLLIPVGLLAAEGAIRAERWSAHLGWSALAGLVLANMFTGSPPRVVYGAMYLAGWMAYRWLFAPLPGVGSRQTHFKRVLTSGIAMSIFGATFGAAAILPQLDFTAQSNVPNADYSNVIGGDYAEPTWAIQDAVKIFFQLDSINQRPFFLGGVIAILALIAILFGGKKYGIPFFALAAFVQTDLSATESVTRWLFYLVPQFEHINSHRPTSTASFVPFAASMLAGAGIQVLPVMWSRQRFAVLALFPLTAFLLMTIWLTGQDIDIEPVQILVAVLATCLIVSPFVLVEKLDAELMKRLTAGVAIGILALLLAFPTGFDFYRSLTSDREWNITRTDYVYNTVRRVTARSDPGTGAEFLTQQQSVLQPFRYAPFTGTGDPGEGHQTALQRRLDTKIAAILANGRATRLGLEQIPGYNVVHFKHYVEYYDVMNGAAQDYHWQEVMTPAVTGSQLLDMLNVRYVLVPAALDPQPPIAEFGTIAYRDAEVIVYENPNAFARAWIVHDVQPAQDGAELDLLNSGQADGHVTAFVHGDLPPVSAPDPNGPADSAIVTSYEPETIELQAKSTGDGLLVLSEVYADGWNAYVDGEKVDILRTNHALRGVPLGAGEHEVVLKYEPLPLKIGLWSTGLSSIAMIGIWIWAGIDWQRRRRRHP